MLGGYTRMKKKISVLCSKSFQKFPEEYLCFQHEEIRILVFLCRLQDSLEFPENEI